MSDEKYSTQSISETLSNEPPIEYIEAALPILEHYLLYQNPGLEEEMEGYAIIRSFANHPDDYIRAQTENVIQRRWAKAGIFEKITFPEESRFKTLRNNRPHYIPNTSDNAYSINENTLMGILLLVDNYSYEESVDTSIFTDQLLRFIGVDKDVERVLENLEKVYILTNRVMYEPLVKKEGDILFLTESAYLHLLPHLPVLKVLTWPEHIVSEEDARISNYIRNRIRTRFEEGINHWNRENYETLAINQQRINLYPSLEMLPWELEKQVQKGEGSIPLFLNNKLVLLRIDRDVDNTYGGFLRASYFQQVKGLENQTITDFWDNILRGKQTGNIEIRYRTTGEFISLSGNYISESLNKLRMGITDVEISKDSMNIEWDDVSNAKQGIFLRVSYANLQSKRYYRQDIEEDVTTIGPNIYSIEITSPDPKKTDNTYPKYLRNKIHANSLDTRHLYIDHLEGAVTLDYKKVEDAVILHFKGENWDKTITLPISINVLELFEEAISKFDTIFDYIDTNRKTIQNNKSSCHKMNLAEELAVRKASSSGIQADDPTIHRENLLHILGTQSLPTVNKIDTIMDSLGEKSVLAMKTYIAYLIYKKDEMLLLEEDPRKKIREIIEEFELRDIPQELLGYIEKLLYH